MTSKAIKFESVEVTSLACDADLAKEHLIEFAHSFIAKEHRARWLHITVEKPEKAYREMVKFSRYHAPDRCQIIHGVDTFPQVLASTYGHQKSVYFDGSGPAVLMSPAEAACMSRDAILSLKPGKQALFFFHEGWAWKCNS